MSEDEDQELKALKLRRLCGCGQYKKSREVCCRRCFANLPKDLMEEVIGAGFGLSTDHPIFIKVRSFCQERHEEIKALNGQYPPRAEGESNAEWYVRLKNLRQSGVRISDEDYAWFAENCDTFRRAHLGKAEAEYRHAVEGTGKVSGWGPAKCKTVRRR